MDTGIRKLAAFPSIRARHTLGNDTAAMIVSTQFEDDSGRPRALLFTLVKQNARWLIRDVLTDTSENIQRRVEGFAAYPGVKFDVRPQDIVGEWESGFLVHARHSFKPDGTGETHKTKDDKTPESFRWEINGDVLKLHSGDKVTEGVIVRMEDDLFAVRYGKSTQWGYHRVKKDTAAPPEANAQPVAGFIGFAFGAGDFREITSVIEGSPAAAAGLQRGDYVTAIDGKATAEIKDMKDFRKALQGAAGTQVQLAVRKAGSRQSSILMLERTAVPTVTAEALNQSDPNKPLVNKERKSQ